MAKDQFHGRKSNFNITMLKKVLRCQVIKDSLHKLRGLVNGAFFERHAVTVIYLKK
jgi:hypothetical protein